MTADLDKALSALSDTAREVYDYLAEQAEHTEGNPLPRTVALCDALDLTRRSVQDALAELGESRLLQISRVYRIETPNGEAAPAI
jgi:DNA-binding FadR family transcriptional regulator